MYKGIKSEFVRNKIKGANWKNKQYMDDLILLEGLVRRGPPKEGMARLYGGNAYIRLRKKYWDEFKALCEELNPKAMESHLRMEREFEEANRRYNLRQKKEEERAKKEWIKMGGVL
ncbi:hypothetical protein HYT58_00790 [Candidatus Woesearchaeota archaeon]|nr:hypothetical protein [Candidatus Woesearchaeota archaeon]